MINLLSFLPKITNEKSKRRGRGLGSNKGAKSGRGTTRHQKARQSISLHFEGGQARMVKKFPLMRGKGRNKSLKKKPIVIALEQLNKFQNGDTVTVAQLIKKKIIKEADKARDVKVLNKGKLEKKIILKVPASKNVKKIVADMNS